MNLQTDNQQTNTISDDQELAKALAGVKDNPDLAFEEPATEQAPQQQPANPTPAAPAPQQPAPLAPNPVPQRTDLEGVKMEAVNELRPLIDKLNLPPEEKFDVYLLLIRCTDDRTLVPPAHDVAKQIEDESRKAQALLDIIKEIDYLTNKPAGQQSIAQQQSQAAQQ